MLYAVRSPLTLSNFAEDSEPMIEKLVYNPVLGLRFKVFECMLEIDKLDMNPCPIFATDLDDERPGLVASE